MLAHAFDPKSYGPAGGYSIYTGLVAGVMYVFGFIVAATLGCTAGSVDLTEGMFRHLVVTGRSRLALYLARIPAGLAIVVPLVAIGFTIVCAVCVFAAPTRLNYDGVNVPAGLSRAGFESWAGDHPDLVVCDFPYRRARSIEVPTGNVALRPERPGRQDVTRGRKADRAADRPPQLRAAAIQIARQNYSELLLPIPLPVRLPHDQVRVVARARSAHRVRRRPRARVPARAEDGRCDLDDRARDHPDADLLAGTYPPPVEPAACGGRRRHGPSGAGRHSRCSEAAEEGRGRQRETHC